MSEKQSRLTEEEKEAMRKTAEELRERDRNFAQQPPAAADQAQDLQKWVQSSTKRKP